MHQIQSLYSKSYTQNFIWNTAMCPVPNKFKAGDFLDKFILKVRFISVFFRRSHSQICSLLNLITAQKKKKRNQKKNTFLEKPCLSLIDSNKIRTHNHLVRKRTNDWAVLWVFICTMHFTVCFYHATYEFQSESTLYNLTECQRTSCSKQVSYLKFKWQQSYIAPASRKEFLDIKANYRVWIHSETRTWYDNDIQSYLSFSR